MAKIPRRIRNSYDVYLRLRQERHEKGYGLDRQLTLEEYATAHARIVHSGEKHPARKIATSDVTFSRKEASAIIRRLKTADQYEDVDKEQLKKLCKRYQKAKDIYSLELTPEEAEANEQMRRERLAARGITPNDTIQASARSRIFNELRDAGLSYKEADEVLYG